MAENTAQPGDAPEAAVDSEPKSASAGDPREKFREALERKKQAQAGRPSAPGTTGNGIGAHSKAGGKREFRRKSS